MKANMKRRMNLQMKRIIALVVMGSIAVTSAVSVAAFSRKVNIEDGEQTHAFMTISRDTEQILDQAGIILSENDDITRTDDGKDTIYITVKRAFDVAVTVDGTTKSLVFTDGTVADAVKASGVVLGENDVVTPDPATKLTAEMEISIQRRYKIQLVLAGEEAQTVIVPEGSVKNALDFLSIELSDDDAVNVDKESLVKENMLLRVDRVEYREIKQTETIPYDTLISLSDTLYEGETEVEDGEEGQREIITRDKIVNGKVIESRQISNEIIKQSKPARKWIGVKPKQTETTASKPVSSGYSKNNNDGTFVDHYGNTISYTSVLTGAATAYTASVGASTSTGRPAQYGNVAVNPNIIPYGTRLYIASPDGSFVYGYAVAADTGGALMSGSALVDLYYDTLEECYQFGRRNVSIYILG